jgi:hypothetical protein
MPQSTWSDSLERLRAGTGPWNAWPAQNVAYPLDMCKLLTDGGTSNLFELPSLQNCHFNGLVIFDGVKRRKPGAQLERT